METMRPHAHTTNLALVILLVADPAASAEFYQRLLGIAPAEQSPTFAMIPLPSGIGLGLWSTATVEPQPTGQAGSSELCFMEREVDALYAAWAEREIPMAQRPVDLDFGRTFVALDPDGHRIRVFWPSDAAEAETAA